MLDARQMILALLLCLFAVPVAAMDQHVEGNRLVMTGPVDGLDYDRFINNLTSNVQVIELVNSTGGDLEAAFNVAQEIRRRRLATVVRGYCMSACALMFLGGTERSLADEKSFVAFHSGYKPHIDYPSGEWPDKINQIWAELIPNMPEDLLRLILSKHRHGFVYFFQSVTYNCDGTEPKRPRGCATLSVTAVRVGVINANGGEGSENGKN